MVQCCINSGFWCLNSTENIYKTKELMKTKTIKNNNKSKHSIAHQMLTILTLFFNSKTFFGMSFQVALKYLLSIFGLGLIIQQTINQDEDVFKFQIRI